MDPASNGNVSHVGVDPRFSTATLDAPGDDTNLIAYVALRTGSIKGSGAIYNIWPLPGGYI